MLTNPRMKSVMKHDFSSVPHADIPRSNFRRSHGLKTAFDSGYLIPIFVDECLPGDSFNLNMSSVARLATPLTPFMDNLHMDFFFFFVPNRLLWNNWQKFMGEQTDPGDSIDYTIPTVSDSGSGFALNSLYDYFGIPTGINPITVNNLHGRAYNLIFNDWFRCEYLQDSVTVDKDDGPDTIGDYVLLKRGKRHDYFTSSLPWPQKGDAIDLPLGTSAPIDYVPYTECNDPMLVRYGADDTLATNQTLTSDAATAALRAGNYAFLDPNGRLEADLSGATAATINSLREAFQLQKMLERDARGGTRYTEIVQSHFGVTSPDARLQRPEYLGGGSTPVQVQPVANTSADGTNNQGDLTALAFQQSSGIGFTKSFVEHGIILGLVSVRADLTYQQGIDKMWSRQTRYDYYFPALAHLGEQEVLNKEIWADGTSVDDEVFGYQERWAEMRYKQSKITGILRSDAAASLDVWHLSQDFATLPALNSDFIEENPPVSRVVAVPSEPEFIFDGYFDLVCTRPMPTYSVPGLIDHF